MALASVNVHSSQFPENVRRDLLHCLRARTVNHKFHYDSYKQAQKWLALHEAHSPARTDADCASIYETAFRAAALLLPAPHVQVIGLGCGGGQKDARLLRLLADQRKTVMFRPCDVSVPLVLTATDAARQAVSGVLCEPLVFDLATADLMELFPNPTKPGVARLITFFGMLPNFEAELILPRLAGLLNHRDSLLVSANLAPGTDYGAGMKKILPGYDNALTRDWLITFLLDLGFSADDGKVGFAIEDSAVGYKRVAAYFDLTKSRTITIHNEVFTFRAGECIRLFYSYRYTPDLIRWLFQRHRLLIRGHWLASSGEEGVFLCQKE